MIYTLKNVTIQLALNSLKLCQKVGKQKHKKTTKNTMMTVLTDSPLTEIQKISIARSNDMDSI